VEAVTLDELTDSLHGDLDGAGNCSVGQVIAVGDFYECAFPASVTGNAGYSETDTVTAVVHDDEANEASDSDSATVTIDDVLPAIAVTKTASPINVPEPGGTVTFTVEVDNLSIESVTLITLTDDVHGDLDGQGNCVVSGLILVGETYTCSFQAQVSGNAGYSENDTVTATAVDDEGNPASGQDSANVAVTGILPAITVFKTAAPESVPEPGGMVLYTVQVFNVSGEAATVITLTDSIHGDLNGQGNCAVGQGIASGGYYECGFSVGVWGNAGYSETDTVTAVVQDDETNSAENSDSATVWVTDVDPAITNLVVL
jgi:uncharacterized repeat protein (TIGR01451 family)